MIKEVIQKGAEILRVPCEPVVDFSVARPIVQDLVDTIDYLKTTYPFGRGIGLAAPQIGHPLRISVAENAIGDRYILINPKIVESSGTKKPIREGCISFLEFRGMVSRHEWVRVQASDLEGKQYEVKADGDFAILLEHELDHLDGVLYTDHLSNGEKDLFLVEALK